MSDHSAVYKCIVGKLMIEVVLGEHCHLCDGTT